jgi:DNA-binding NarL/FixJ family response regulator
MDAQESLKVLIIDDHALFREGLKIIIDNDERFEIVGEAGTGGEGLEMAKDLKPDIVILDLGLPDVSGVRIIRSLLEASPGAKIIVVTMYSKIGYIAESFQVGATGYVVKESASDSLLKGMHAVSNGEYFLDGRVSTEVIGSLVNLPIQQADNTDENYAQLTSREQEVMRMLAEGMTIKDISAKLFISPKTVENHKSNIMRKLGLSSAVDLVKYSARIGLIDVDLWK